MKFYIGIKSLVISTKFFLQLDVFVPNWRKNLGGDDKEFNTDIEFHEPVTFSKREENILLRVAALAKIDDDLESDDGPLFLSQPLEDLNKIK